MSKVIDMANQKFGKLLVIERVSNDTSGRARWKCKCDCGNEIVTTGKSLRNGSSTSCGYCGNKTKKIDETGNRYGKLTVLKSAPTIKNKSYWLCQCDCGTQIIVCGNSLRTGNTKSCGCITSLGESAISKLLQDYNIPFQKEKTFESCRFIDTQGLARFDFYVNHEYLIEYDGYQHFGLGLGWTGNAENIQKRDAYKNQWCLENNIPLIRIPYIKLPDLCIEDLMLETSQYIIEKEDQ